MIQFVELSIIQDHCVICDLLNLKEVKTENKAVKFNKLHSMTQPLRCAEHYNETKTFAVLANQRALLVSRNDKKNLKNNSKTMVSTI